MVILELCKVDLKSIRYVSMFTSLKELYLSGNLIAHIKGMEEMAQL